MLFQSRSFCGNDQKDLQTDLFEQKQIWSRIQKQNQFLIFLLEFFIFYTPTIFISDNKFSRYEWAKGTDVIISPFQPLGLAANPLPSKNSYVYPLALYLFVVSACLANSFQISLAGIVCDQICYSVRPNEHIISIIVPMYCTELRCYLFLDGLRSDLLLRPTQSTPSHFPPSLLFLSE